jgi:hypothetical protein
MGNASTLHVGLDVHKDSIAVAYAPAESGRAPVPFGTIGTTSATRSPWRAWPVPAT